MKRRIEVRKEKYEVRWFGMLMCFFLLLTSYLLPQYVHAESLSDLNTKGFQDRTAPAVRSAENPFLKQNVSPQDLMVEDLRLEGIVYNPHSAYALISGFSVREGDEIGGYRVKTVEKDRVVLRQLDQIKVLRLE